MSKFVKIILFLILVLFLEVLLIFKNEPIHKDSGLTLVSYNPKKSIVILIDLTSSSMEVFQEGNIIKTYPISGGAIKTPSPIGVFTIVSKDTWG